MLDFFFTPKKSCSRSRDKILIPNSMTQGSKMSISDVRKPNKKNMISGINSTWEVVVGIEVHAQIKSQSKLFSESSTSFGAHPNNNVSLIDSAMPGMLPVLNKECVCQAIRTGLALKAQINLKSFFERKHYFYPDLPQGYQISQFRKPIIGEGKILISIGQDKKGEFEDIEIGIERLHLEQDAGKSIHDKHPSMSLIDLNRSGIGLMEIVSKPDIRSSQEAKAYLSKLRSILRYIETCDGNMEKGSMRADINISVRRPGQPFGTRCEIKNVNSIRFVGQAIDYEARRQIEILEQGKQIHQETRSFNAEEGKTHSLRSKEEAHDYRYFPDPDLPPLQFNQSFVDQLAKTLPELPDDRRNRLIYDMDLSPYNASVLIAEKTIVDYFESVAKGRNSKMTANWIINDLLGALNKRGLSIEESPISTNQLGMILDMIQDGTISGKIAKKLFEIIWNEGGNPLVIVEQRGMKQVIDSQTIEKTVSQIIEENPDKAMQAKKQQKLVGWFIGQVMKRTNGQAHPEIVNALIKEKLQINT